MIAQIFTYYKRSTPEMKIKDLIAKLSMFDPNLNVKIRHLVNDTTVSADIKDCDMRGYAVTDQHDKQPSPGDVTNIVLLSETEMFLT